MTEIVLRVAFCIVAPLILLLAISAIANGVPIFPQTFWPITIWAILSAATFIWMVMAND